MLPLSSALVTFQPLFNTASLYCDLVEKLTRLAGQRIRNYDLSRRRDYLLSRRLWNPRRYFSPALSNSPEFHAFFSPIFSRSSTTTPIFFCWFFPSSLPLLTFHQSFLPLSVFTSFGWPRSSWSRGLARSSPPWQIPFVDDERLLDLLFINRC